MTDQPEPLPTVPESAPREIWDCTYCEEQDVTIGAPIGQDGRRYHVSTDSNSEPVFCGPLAPRPVPEPAAERGNARCPRFLQLGNPDSQRCTERYGHGGDHHFEPPAPPAEPAPTDYKQCPHCRTLFGTYSGVQHHLQRGCESAPKGVAIMVSYAPPAEPVEAMSNLVPNESFEGPPTGDELEPVEETQRDS